MAWPFTLEFCKELTITYIYLKKEKKTIKSNGKFQNKLCVLKSKWMVDLTII